MFKLDRLKHARTLLFSAAVVGVSAFALAQFSALGEQPVIAGDAPASGSVTPSGASFPADAGSLGAIADGGNLTPCGASGAPKNVTFNVTGLSGATTNVELSMTFAAPAHTFRGDLVASLIAPNGASHTLFARTGATSATSFGSSNDLTGPYNFRDAAAGTNWWTVAATPTTPGDYRTTAAGPTTNPAAVTSIAPAFSGVTNANGSWTLRLVDCTSGDTGSISAATLTLETAAAPTQNIVDFDGDGKTDFVLGRNTGGGPTGQLTWFINLNGPGTNFGALWGLNGDFYVPEDYDGDNKTDVAVWRAGPPTQAAFYILQSATSTLRIDTFGQTGDDPTVIRDYDGDGKADAAVYRPGASAGQPSTWFYRGSLSNPSGNVTFVPWGQNGDFPAPGDYDGDGKGDFVVQRNNGGGQARFWMNQTTAGQDSIVFGTPTDVIVPGDYDGDGKTDIATVRGAAGSINWWVRPSSTGVISAVPWAVWGASATDFPVQGDYDGDGKTDVAVWRPSATAGASAFWAIGSTSGAIVFPYGINSDYPVANYNSH